MPGLVCRIYGLDSRDANTLGPKEPPGKSTFQRKSWGAAQAEAKSEIKEQENKQKTLLFFGFCGAGDRTQSLTHFSTELYPQTQRKLLTSSLWKEVMWRKMFKVSYGPCSQLL